MNKIRILGKDYPCRFTMGAALEYKNMTGTDVTQMDKAGVSDILTFLYCCVKSACRVDKIEFDLDLQDFADNLSMDDVLKWQESQTAMDSTKVKGGKKK